MTGAVCDVDDCTSLAAVGGTVGGLSYHYCRAHHDRLFEDTDRWTTNLTTVRAANGRTDVYVGGTHIGTIWGSATAYVFAWRSGDHHADQLSATFDAALDGLASWHRGRWGW